LDLFKESMEWVRASYTDFGFIIERDFVWTIQKYLSMKIQENALPYAVFNDYPIEKGTHRSKSVDLAVIRKGITHTDILSGKSCAELVVEFKFEPSMKRVDICTHKLPVVFWDTVNEDIDRIKRFTENGIAKAGVAVFIDEYGRYKKDSYPINHYSKWLDWGSYNTDKFSISVLWTSFRFKCES